jgi:hypothetical protein
VELKFGTRATLQGITIGTILCDETVLSRGTTLLSVTTTELPAFLDEQPGRQVTNVDRDHNTGRAAASVS